MGDFFLSLRVCEGLNKDGTLFSSYQQFRAAGINQLKETCCAHCQVCGFIWGFC